MNPWFNVLKERFLRYRSRNQKKVQFKKKKRRSNFGECSLHLIINIGRLTSSLVDHVVTRRPYFLIPPISFSLAGGFYLDKNKRGISYNQGIARKRLRLETESSHMVYTSLVKMTP